MNTPQVLMSLQKAQAVCKWAASAVCWLTLTTALTTFVVVVMRYGFTVGSVALQEAIMYQHAFVFMLYAAYALGQDGHVRVDVFYRNWSTRTKAWINLVGSVLFLLPTIATIFIFSWEYVLSSWSLLEGSKEAGGLPIIFIMKSLIPAFCILMFIQCIAQGALSITTIITESISR